MQVVDPRYMQVVLGTRPEEAANHAVFVHDHFYSFTSTIFYGNEVR